MKIEMKENENRDLGIFFLFYIAESKIKKNIKKNTKKKSKEKKKKNENSNHMLFSSFVILFC